MTDFSNYLAHLEAETGIDHRDFGDLAKTAGVGTGSSCPGCGAEMTKDGSILKCSCGRMKKAHSDYRPHMHVEPPGGLERKAPLLGALGGATTGGILGHEMVRRGLKGTKLRPTTAALGALGYGASALGGTVAGTAGGLALSSKLRNQRMQERQVDRVLHSMGKEGAASDETKLPKQNESALDKIRKKSTQSLAVSYVEPGDGGALCDHEDASSGAVAVQAGVPTSSIAPPGSPSVPKGVNRSVPGVPPDSVVGKALREQAAQGGAEVRTKTARDRLRGALTKESAAGARAMDAAVRTARYAIPGIGAGAGAAASPHGEREGGGALAGMLGAYPGAVAGGLALGMPAALLSNSRGLLMGGILGGMVAGAAAGGHYSGKAYKSLMGPPKKKK